MHQPPARQTFPLQTIENGYKYVKMCEEFDNNEDEKPLCEFDHRNHVHQKIHHKKCISIKCLGTAFFALISLILIIFIIIAVVCFIERPRNYRGHKVIQVVPTTLEQLKNIIQIEHNFNVEYWNQPHFKYPDEPILIQVQSGDQEKNILEEFNKLKLNYSLVIEDLYEAIEEERVAHQAVENETEFVLNRYHTYEEIINYIDDYVINQRYAQIKSIGGSFEGRKIPLIVITDDECADNKCNQTKPIILIDSLIHSNEWITGATSLYIINDLLHNIKVYPYLKKFEFHFIPVLNPDGYVYSWRTDRLWKKTRSITFTSLSCRGADANRNFDSHFCSLPDEEDVSPCSDNYCGDYPFSEQEMDKFKDYVLKLNETRGIKAYFSLHSYRQLIMYPWSYSDGKIQNSKELQHLTNVAVDAIKSKHGSTYKAGSAANTLYPVSGVSIDWFLEKLNVNLSFEFEVGGGGQYGYLLPKDLILPTAEEAWTGIKSILDLI